MKQPWYEDDEFWQVVYPLLFHETQWANAPYEVDQILDMTGLEGETAVLDLCCGPGRHSLELARRGFQVTGVDQTASFLDEARRRANEEKLTVEWVQADMREFVRPNAFDAALLLFTSFGYFEEADDNRQVLVNIANSLKPGGNLVLEMQGKENLARMFLPKNWNEFDGTFWLQERCIVNDWNQIQNRWIVIREDARFEYFLTHWLYSAGEITELLHDSGFSMVSVYGGPDKAPYDHTARGLFVVGQK